jgi:flagellar biosynthesis/type III secretory pathway chaperone
MTALLSRLLDALRHELQQYGEILALLDQQREFVMARSGDQVLQSVANINEQTARIQGAREQRLTCQRELAQALGQREDAAFEMLVPLLPESHRFAVSSLVRENNDLLARVQQRARQNHLLLSRSLELMQRFLGALMPGGQPTIYNGEGNLQTAPPPSQSLYEATG